MRDYSRVYHTSLDYLSHMPMGRLIDELGDAVEDLAAERREREKEIQKQKAKAKASRVSKPRRRRR